MFRSCTAVAALLASALLGGCGMSSVDGGRNSSSPSTLSGAKLGGIVHGGQNPIYNATIQLYQVGTTGYSSAAVPLLTSSVKTDASGGFVLTGKYTCTPGTYLYLTAAGGSPQLSSSPSTVNNNITLASALGLCDNLSASSYIMVNEVSTVAAAYALAHFAGGTNFGHTLVSQPGSGSTAPADNFASTSANEIGLGNAMAIAQVLANTSTGTAPGSNSNGTATAEWWQINLIANILAACVNSTGGSAGDGTNCGVLFSNVTPSGGAAPADTLQAAIDLALSPSLPTTAIAALYGEIPSTAPFQPYPITAAAVSDFSVAVTYTPTAGTTKLLTQPQSIAIDSLGNAWIGNQPNTGGTAPYAATLVELTPTGVPIQAGPAAGSYEVNSYSLNGTATSLGGQYGYHNSSYGLSGVFAPSIDTNNNVWIADRQNNNIAMIPGSGKTYSSSLSYQNGGNAAAVGYALNANSYPTSIYVDGSNNVWFNMEGSTTPANDCVSLGAGTTITSAATQYTYGVAAFLNESPTNVVVGYNGGGNGYSQPAFLAIDPGVGDVVGTTGSTTPIQGAPFIWTAGVNGAANIIMPIFTQAAGSVSPACYTAMQNIGITPYAGTGSTDPTVNPGHSNVQIADTPNPALSGDYLHFLATPQDWAFDKFGNLWIGNRGQINTETATPASEILTSLSKVTPAYGAALTKNSVSNFTYDVIHNVAGMFDGSTYTSNYPTYLTTDGAGNVLFETSNDRYVNAISNNGNALTQVSGTGTSPQTGFVGSTCSNCTFLGTKATYARQNSASLSRPAVDQAGNIWVPVYGGNTLYLLVGAAVPRVQPDSLGLKNGTFASIP